MLRIILTLGLLSVTGCGKGTMGLLQKANPCLDISIDPIRKTMRIFTNEGRSVEAEEITYGVDPEGNRTFSAKGFKVGERTVENRDADTRAIAATEQLFKTAIRETALGVAMGIREGLAPVRGASGNIETPIGKGGFQLGNGTAPAPMERIEGP